MSVEQKVEENSNPQDEAMKEAFNSPGDSEMQPRAPHRQEKTDEQVAEQIGRIAEKLAARDRGLDGRTYKPGKKAKIVVRKEGYAGGKRIEDKTEVKIGRRGSVKISRNRHANPDSYSLRRVFGDAMRGRGKTRYQEETNLKFKKGGEPRGLHELIAEDPENDSGKTLLNRGQIVTNAARALGEIRSEIAKEENDRRKIVDDFARKP